MFILFNLDNNQAIGVYNEVKPFTRSIYMDDISIIQKKIMMEITTIPEPKQYIDRFGVITNKKTPFNKLVEIKENKEELVTINNHPEYFTYDEVIEFRKEELLAQYPEFDKCIVIESFFDKYIEQDESKNIQLGNNTLIVNNGNIKLKPIELDNCCRAQVLVQADGEYELYTNIELPKIETDSGITTMENEILEINIESKDKTEIDAIFILY